MKIQFPLCSILLTALLNLGCSCSKRNNQQESAPQETARLLYETWRQEFKASILGPNQIKVGDQLVDLGFELSQVDEVAQLKSYQRLVSSDNPAVDSMILEKLVNHERGDEFLAFAYCHRKEWDPLRLLLHAGSPGNAHALPLAVIAAARAHPPYPSNVAPLELPRPAER